MRVYPAEAYSDEQARTRALQEFLVTLRDVSANHFQQEDVTIDSASGYHVNYTTHAGTTQHAYSFGVKGQLWRIDIELPGMRTPLPAPAAQLLGTIRLTP